MKNQLAWLWRDEPISAVFNQGCSAVDIANIKQVNPILLILSISNVKPHTIPVKRGNINNITKWKMGYILMELMELDSNWDQFKKTQLEQTNQKWQRPSWWNWGENAVESETKVLFLSKLQKSIFSQLFQNFLIFLIFLIQLCAEKWTKFKPKFQLS